jgi:hypothetical protein
MFDATKEMAISFSYVADTTGGGGPAGGNPPGGGKAPPGGGPGGGGRVNNPYVAVWIENAESLPVRTISLNYQIGRGDRWLNELQRWFRNEQTRVSKGGSSNIETISSATRVPGAYKVVWDGMDDAKKPVAQGDYFLCVESAREHGPYNLVREPITIGTQPFNKAIADKGELQKVTVELRAHA